MQSNPTSDDEEDIPTIDIEQTSEFVSSQASLARFKRKELGMFVCFYVFFNKKKKRFLY
jgi:hypothetical protein